MIGCGAIARQYLDTARRLDAIEIVAAADRVPARATAVEGRPACRSAARPTRSWKGDPDLGPGIERPSSLDKLCLRSGSPDPTSSPSMPPLGVSFPD